MKKLLLSLVLGLMIFSAPAQIIIDHHCTDLSLIPGYWIDQAKSNLRIAYQHTSHGSQPVRGMYTLGQLYPSMSFNWTGSDYYTGGSGDPGGYNQGIFLNDFGMIDMYGDLGYYGDLTWAYQTHDLLNRVGGCDRNVIIWSWCGGVSDNDATGISIYLNAMDSLEQAYPSVTFVYMTGHLDGSGPGGTLNLMNNQIRDYCVNNHKILFDFADIESYDPDGLVNYMELYATDSCQYDSTGGSDPWSGPLWTTQWINNNPGDSLVTEATSCGYCLHSQELNCMLKGRAFWWMLARIAGWNGMTGIDDHAGQTSYDLWVSPQNDASELPLRFFLPQSDALHFELYSAGGALVYSSANLSFAAGENHYLIPCHNIAKGLYILNMNYSKGNISRKVVIP